MNKLKFCLALGVLSIAAAVAQQNPPSSPTVLTSRLGFPVYGLNAVPISSATLQVVGSAGQSVWYLWAVANYQEGSVMSPIGVVFNAPNTLSSQNYVQVLYSVPANVTVDILATTTALQPSGACGCAVATGDSSGIVNFQSSSLSPYTVSLVNPTSFRLWLTNEVVGSGSTHLLLRNEAGTQIADLSNIGASGVTGSGTNRTMPIWTGTSTLGNSPLILEAGFPIIDNGDQFNMTGTGLTTQTGLAQPAINVGATLGSASTACNATNWSLTANPFPGCSGVFISTGPAHNAGTMGYVASTVANLSFGSTTPALPNVGVGLLGSATIGALSSNNMGDIRGIYGLGTNSGSGSVTALTGVYGQASNFSGASAPTAMRALYAIDVFQASATNSYGLYVDSPSIQNALTVSNQYGIFVADQTVAGSGTNSNPRGIYVAGGGIQTAVHTFSTLPACAAGQEGRMEAVSDSTTAVWGATITGSSTNHVLAYCDGTNWTVAGK